MTTAFSLYFSLKRHKIEDRKKKRKEKLIKPFVARYSPEYEWKWTAISRPFPTRTVRRNLRINSEFEIISELIAVRRVGDDRLKIRFPAISVDGTNEKRRHYSRTEIYRRIGRTWHVFFFLFHLDTTGLNGRINLFACCRRNNCVPIVHRRVFVSLYALWIIQKQKKMEKNVQINNLRGPQKT